MRSDSCPISVQLKTLSELVNFCVAILTLKIEKYMKHFWSTMTYYFKKGENTTEMLKKICAVYGEGAVID